MKLSEWKALFQDLIDGVQSEVGMPIPALDEFRARVNEAAPDPQRRKHFEDELEIFLQSQPFLREAATRHLSKKTSQAIEAATEVLSCAQEFLPKRQTTKEEALGEREEETAPLDVIDVWAAIERAERILPGEAAAEGKIDPRWQAIMVIEDFVPEEPEAIWSFILRWGVTADEDLRSAIATLLLEHLLGHHFSHFFPRVQEAVRSDALLADTFLKCWKCGQAKEGGNGKRFDDLRDECRKNRPKT